MTMPNFLIIGAAKSGTTSLYLYLQQHPQIYMSPNKEPSFFAYEGQQIDLQWWGNPPTPILQSITDLASYQALFQSVSDERAVGEASTYYLYNSRAPARIHHYIPDVKLIVILRHPADRAFSQYVFLKQLGRESCSTFEEALQEEASRMAANWAWDYSYRDMGFYSVQLKRYMERFEPAQIKIFLYEELSHNAPSLLKKTFNFLEVDESFTPDTSFRYNVTRIPQNMALYNFMGKTDHPIKKIVRILVPDKLRRRIGNSLRDKNLYKPTLRPETRRQLSESYREEIMVLQDLIQRDLTGWLQ